jgi:hypothetical protein
VTPDLGDHVPTVEAQLTSDVLENRGPRDRIKDELAARGQKREPVLDLSLESLPAGPGQRAVLEVEAELATLLAYEVQDGEHRLGRSSA